jgi:uncharacterized damage-inducible protein DinB
MRTDPEPTGSELDLLIAYLDYQRQTVLDKADDLTPAQLVSAHPPSKLTLAGLLYHLALVEETWMEVRFAGLPTRDPWTTVDWDADPDWEFRTAESMEPADLRARCRAAGERTRQIAGAATGGDQLSVTPRDDGQHFSLRWVLLHMIEETARHAGHADFIREAIDGAVGE